MNESILIIDDSPTLRKLLHHYLRKKGYSIFEANNGKSGLEDIQNNTYDLIILDMNMPVMNGFEVLARLKEKPDFTIPILILSADKEQASKAEGLSLGASYYLTKPFKPTEVVQVIERIFATRINN